MHVESKQISSSIDTEAIRGLEIGEAVWLRYDSNDGTTFVRLSKTGADSYRLYNNEKKKRGEFFNDQSLEEIMDLISNSKELRGSRLVRMHD